MREYETIDEIKRDLDEYGNLIIKDHLRINCHIPPGVVRDISAWDITAWNLVANDIEAVNILAWDIKAKDITYWAVCVCQKNCICKSAKGTRENALPVQCLDGKLTILPDTTITLANGEKIELSKESYDKLVEAARKGK